MAGRTPQHTNILIIGGVGLAALVALVVSLDPINPAIWGAIRVAAVLGYLAIFLALASSNYMRELTRYFGRRFVALHHLVALTGLSSISLHAIMAAIQWGTLRAFLPSRTTLQALALWFFVVATLAGFFRKRIGKSWKFVHWLNYLAFWIGTAHALSVGTNVQHLVVKIVVILMALVILGLFVWKRAKDAQRKRRRKKK